MLVLKEPFKTAWANKDPFEEVLKLNGEIYREVGWGAKSGLVKPVR